MGEDAEDGGHERAENTGILLCYNSKYRRNDYITALTPHGRIFWVLTLV